MTRHSAYPVGERTRRSERDDYVTMTRRLAHALESRDTALYDQLVDRAVRDVTDSIVRTVETYATETATRMSVARKPTGGVSILRSRTPGGTLDIALERFAQRLVCRSWFTPQLGRTVAGPRHDAQIAVGEEGNALVFVQGGRPLTLDDVERTWVRPFLARI